MANICIPRELIDKVRNTIIATGDNSLERLKAFQEIYGGDLKQAQELNLLYEKGKLLKRQNDVVGKFIDKITGLSPEKKIELQTNVANELARKTEILNKEELLSIVKNAVDKKFKVDINPNDANAIGKIKAEVNQLKDAGLQTPEGSPERIAWGMKQVELSEYIDNIVNPNSKLGLIDSLKASYREDRTRIANQPSNLGKTGEAASMATELLTSPVYKSLKAAVDASFALRQGFKVLTKDPKAFYTANKKAFDILFSSKQNSENAYKAFRANLITSDLYQKAVDSGLALSKIEDFFPTPIGEKVPFLGTAFKNSDSAFSVFSQSARMDLFEKMYKNQVKILGTEPSEEITKGLAMLSNSITGRGSFGRFENVAVVANKLLFSGRYIKSAIDTFTLPFDSKLPEAVRKEALKSSVATLSTMAALMTTASAFTDVEFDPRSSKFGKAKIPNTDRWIDLTAGLGSYMTLASRVGLGVTTDVAGATKIKPYVNGKGQESNFNTGKFGGATIASTIGDWASNKLAPAPSALLQIAKGRDYSGKKPTLPGTALNLIAPISPQNAIEGFMQSKDSITAQLIGTISDALGASQTDYGKFK